MTERVSADVLVDVGGTKTRIAQLKNGSIHHISSLRSNDYGSFVDLLRDYFGQTPSYSVRRILIGAAGPVVNQEVQLTNVAWKVSASQLKNEYPGTDVEIFNDLGAVAKCLTSDRIGSSIESVFGQFTAESGRRVVVSPGTGLGVAVILAKAEGRRVIDTEAGHMRAAPLSPEMLPLFSALFESQPYISSEDLISGPGILRIFEFFKKHGSDESNLGCSITTPEDVVRDAAQNPDGTAGLTMKVFVQYLGSFCGDLAIAYKASGGVFLAGNIVNAVKHGVFSQDFEAAFLDRGSMVDFVKGIPVGIITAKEPVMEGLRTYGLTK